MIGYTKYKHYIITIDTEEQTVDNNYKMINCDKFTVIEIKDILNKYYDKIDKYKIGEIYDERIYFYILEELAFNKNFMLHEQYKLFPNGYSGQFRSYDHDDKLIEDFFHINGRLEGIYIGYFNEHHIKCEYINGKLNGKYIQYNNNNSNIQYDYTFANGMKHGLCIDYDKNENIITKIEYDNGNFNGYYYEIDNVDKKIIECTYKKNVLNGEYKEYDLNKKLMLKCNYNFGKLVDYSEYDENDNIKFFKNIS
jgi:antitoxin component YwqK of YwqJK toxin-antitoxin module